MGFVGKRNQMLRKAAPGPDAGEEASQWVTHYTDLRDVEADGCSRSPASTRSTSPSCCLLESLESGSCPSMPPKQTSSSSLREYGSIGNREALQWLWLDYSKAAHSAASKRLKRKLSGHNLVVDDVSRLVSITEEPGPVGLSLLPPMGEGSMLAGVFTLVSSAMGAGCLSLPYMFKESGILLGLLMLVLGAVLAHVSLVVLMACARYTDSESMANVVALVGRGRGGNAVDLVIAIYGIAAVLCYLIFIGDFFSGIVRSPFLDWTISRETLIIFLAATVVWPLSLLRTLTALRYVCVLSVLSICVTAFVVAFKTPGEIAQTFNSDSSISGEAANGFELKWWNWDPKSVLQSFSIALFAFAAHTNAVPVANALKVADGRSIWSVSLYSVCIELVFYTIMGLGGYLSFRETTKQDFILNYSNDDRIIFLVRCVYGIVVCLGAPINLSPAASSVLGLISTRSGQCVQGRHLRRLRPLVVTAIVAACVCIAVCSEHIADVIGLIGASFGSLIVLAWPALIYRRVLYDLHPPALAKSVYATLVTAAAIGFIAFASQACGA